MDAEQMEAVRELIEFAKDHAREVYGEKEEYEYGTNNGGAILEAARIVEGYMDVE